MGKMRIVTYVVVQNLYAQLCVSAVQTRDEIAAILIGQNVGEGPDGQGFVG